MQVNEMAMKGKPIEGIPAGRDSVIDEDHEFTAAVHQAQHESIMHNVDALSDFRGRLGEQHGRRARNTFAGNLSRFLHKELGYTPEHVAEVVGRRISIIAETAPEEIRGGIGKVMAHIGSREWNMAAIELEAAAKRAFELDSRRSDAAALYHSAGKLYSLAGFKGKARQMEDTARDIA